MRRTASPVAVGIGIGILYLVWGSTYLSMRVAVASMPPFVMGGLRFVIAGAILVPSVVASGRGRLPRPTVVGIRDAAIVGAFLVGAASALSRGRSRRSRPAWRPC